MSFVHGQLVCNNYLLVVASLDTLTHIWVELIISKAPRILQSNVKLLASMGKCVTLHSKVSQCESVSVFQTTSCGGGEASSRSRFKQLRYHLIRIRFYTTA